MIAQTKTVAELSRAIEVTQPIYDTWKKQYGGMQVDEAKRLSCVSTSGFSGADKQV